MNRNNGGSGAGTGFNNLSVLGASLPNSPNVSNFPNTGTNIGIGPNSNIGANIIEQEAHGCEPFKPVPKGKETLFPRQDIAIHRANQYCNKKSILLLHEVGTGKTITSLVMALNAIKATLTTDSPKNRIIIICPSGIFKNFHKEVNESSLTQKDSTSKIGNKDTEGNNINSPLYFNANIYETTIHFHGYKYSEFYTLFFNNTETDYLARVDIIAKTINGSVIIFDEAHRLLRLIKDSEKTYLDLFNQNGSNPFVDRKVEGQLCSPLKTIFMTGTPYNLGFKDIFKFINFLAKIDNSSNTQFETDIYYRTLPYANDSFLYIIAVLCAILNIINPLEPAFYLATGGMNLVIRKIRQISNDFFKKRLRLPFTDAFEPRLGSLVNTYTKSMQNQGINSINLRENVETMIPASAKLKEGLRKRFINRIVPEAKPEAKPETKKTQGGGGRAEALHTLGLNESASQADIRRAYLNLARQTHTNKTRSNTRDEFEKIKEAYNIASGSTDNINTSRSNIYSQNITEYNESTVKLFQIINGIFETEENIYRYLITHYSIIMSQDFINYINRFQNEILTYLDHIQSADDMLDLIYYSAKEFKEKHLTECSTDLGMLSYIYNTLNEIERIEYVSPLSSDIPKSANIISQKNSIIQVTDEISPSEIPTLTDKATIKACIDTIISARAAKSTLNTSTQYGGNGSGINIASIVSQGRNVITTINNSGISEIFNQINRIVSENPNASIMDIISQLYKASTEGIYKQILQYVWNNFSDMLKYGGTIVMSSLVAHPLVTAFILKSAYEIGQLIFKPKKGFLESYLHDRQNSIGTKIFLHIARKKSNITVLYNYKQFFEDASDYISFFLKDMKNISKLYTYYADSGCALPGYSSTSLHGLNKSLKNKQLLVKSDLTTYPEKCIRYYYTEYTQDQNLFHTDLNNLVINEQKWWVQIAEVKNNETWLSDPRNFVLRSIGNYSRGYMYHKAVWNPSKNNYEIEIFDKTGSNIIIVNGSAEKNILNLDLFINDVEFNNKIKEFTCPKFKLILIQLILMRCGYIFDNEQGLVKQAHYIYDNNKTPISIAGKTIELNISKTNNNGSKTNATHGFLPFVYSISEFMGLNNFAMYLSMLGLKYELLHENDNNIASVNNRVLEHAYPLVELPDREKLAKLILKLHSTGDVDAQTRLFDVILNAIIQMPIFKEHPICILLHPNITEGIDGKYNPAILLMDVPHTYGDYEQLCGRVLRSYAPPGYNKTEVPKKYILQYLTYNENNLKDIVNSRFEFIKKEESAGEGFLYDKSGNIRAGIITQNQSKRLKVKDYKPLDNIISEYISLIFNPGRVKYPNTQKVVNATEIGARIQNTKNVLQNLMIRAGYNTPQKWFSYFFNKYKLSGTAHYTFIGYMFDRLRLIPYLTQPSLGVALQTENVFLMRDSVEYYNERLETWTNKKIIEQLKQSQNTSESSAFISSKSMSREQQLQANKDIKKLQIILDQAFHEDLITTSYDILALKEINIVEYQIKSFVNLSIDYEKDDNLILDLSKANKCIDNDSVKSSAKWCDLLSKTDTCTPTGPVSDKKTIIQNEDEFLTALSQSDPEEIKYTYAQYNTSRGYTNIPIPIRQQVIPESTLRHRGAKVEESQPSFLQKGLQFITGRRKQEGGSALRVQLRSSGRRTRRVPKRKLKHRSTIKSKSKSKKYNYHRTFKH